MTKLGCMHKFMKRPEREIVHIFHMLQASIKKSILICYHDILAAGFHLREKLGASKARVIFRLLTVQMYHKIF